MPLVKNPDLMQLGAFSLADVDPTPPAPPATTQESKPKIPPERIGFVLGFITGVSVIGILWARASLSK
ncbi:Uncharacterised protein [uncultured archaeon]|nr:Uncharacterised protein [uncultured archaeon]